MKITKYAQSCLFVEINNKKILIDPGTFVFNEEGLKPDNFSDIDVILITHEHSDHLDLDNIAKLIEINQPKIYGLKSVVELIKQSSSEADINAVASDSKIEFDDISISVLDSTHGPLPNGNPAPEVLGYVIDDGENRLYTPGDTTELNAEAKADIIAVPICGTVVLSIDQAKEQLLELSPKLAIPIHYDNPKYPVDVQDFVQAMADTNTGVKVLGWGERIEV